LLINARNLAEEPNESSEEKKEGHRLHQSKDANSNIQPRQKPDG